MEDKVEHSHKEQPDLDFDFDFDPIINQRLNRKFDLHVVPFLFGIWYGRSTPHLRGLSVTDITDTRDYNRLLAFIE